MGGCSCRLLSGVVVLLRRDRQRCWCPTTTHQMHYTRTPPLKLAPKTSSYSETCSPARKDASARRPARPRTPAGPRPGLLLPWTRSRDSSSSLGLISRAPSSGDPRRGGPIFPPLFVFSPSFPTPNCIATTRAGVGCLPPPLSSAPPLRIPRRRPRRSGPGARGPRVEAEFR